MARGGKRPGSGRPKGATTRRTQEIAARAQEQGLTPLEVMLDNMRFAVDGAQKALACVLGEDGGINAYNQLLELRKLAQDCAKDAAPYMHPRLQAIEHTGQNGKPIKIVLSRDDARL